MTVLKKIGLCCSVVCAPTLSSATDFACDSAPALHLAHAGALPIAASAAANIALGKLADISTQLLLDVPNRYGQTQQQVNPTDAVAEAKKFSKFELTLAERKRLAASGACVSAYRALVTRFEVNKVALGFNPGEHTLSDFVPWYYDSSLPAAMRLQAAPVVAAEEAFERECMEKTIPPELNPAWVEQAVGVISFGDKVICTALRIAADKIVTAKHCFLNADNGRISPAVAAAKAGKASMWFSYPAEPAHRYGLCRASLPAAIVGRVSPDLDHVTLTMRATAAPVAPLSWSTSAPPNGHALYLRGFFPFASHETTMLGRLRSSSSGGCIAHAGAGRCFFHACQTTPLMSGAPVFMRPEPGAVPTRLQVAGMHLGAASLSDPKGVNGAVCDGADGTDVSSSNFAYIP
jgi:hypothetical protein